MPRKSKKTQPIRVASGQPYGERQAQEAAQRAVPLPAAPDVPAATPQSAPPTGGRVPPAPGSFGAFTRPTERPNEPLTAGMTIGAGPGREALTHGVNHNGDVEAQLLALYRTSPHNSLLRLLREVRAKAVQTQSFGGTR